MGCWWFQPSKQKDEVLSEEDSEEGQRNSGADKAEIVDMRQAGRELLWTNDWQTIIDDALFFMFFFFHANASKSVGRE